jgi:hypothetical protein
MDLLSKVKFRTLTQDEFDARYPAVPEPEARGPRFTGEVQVSGVGWVPASVFKGLPDMYFHNDEWVRFQPKTEFTKIL